MTVRARASSSVRSRPGALRCLGTAAVALSLVLTTAGCWSSKEIDALAFATSAGIDRDPQAGGILVTMRIVKPEALATGQTGLPHEKAFWTVSAAGRTVLEAVRGLSQLVPRRLFGGHIRLVVIGEDLAREGVGAHLDFVDREGDVSRGVRIIIAGGATAREFLETEYESAPAADLGLENQLTSCATNMGIIAVVNLNDFLIALETPGREPIAPRGAIIEKIPGSIAGEVERSEVRASPLLGGLAVFRQDRLAGWLEPLDTRGLLWATGQIRSAVSVVPCPCGGGRTVALKTINHRTRIKPVISGDDIAMQITVEVETALAEAESYVDPADWPGYIKQLERSLADAVAGEIRSCLHRCQAELGADVFGFGAAVYRTDPSVWKRIEGQWDEIFRSLPVEIDVNAIVRRSGVIGRSLRVASSPATLLPSASLAAAGEDGT